MGPHPAVADTRRAVRLALGDVEAGDLVLVACSGGADSLALAAAVAFEAPRLGVRAGGLTVDHGLQEGSASRAHAVVRRMRELGLSPADAVVVTVGTRGGPEAAARDARYAALRAGAEEAGATAVLLGHTRDDQAETVLLGLARGSGARSLAGMAPAAGLYRRPFLSLGRATTEKACSELGIVPWEDPHNSDPSYARVRVRLSVLPLLEGQLGPGIAEALARTARLLRDDADALDEWADRVYAQAVESEGCTLVADGLAALPAAIRRRVLRRAAVEAGSPSGALTAAHLDAVERLITAWRGQQGVDLPGGVVARREYGRLLLSRAEGS